MPKNVKVFESSAFKDAQSQAEREQSEFRSMLETYRSPRTIADAERASKHAAKQSVQAGNGS